VLGDLPNKPVNAIRFSPSYAGDSTVFLAGALGLYRSVDGGSTWIPTGAQLGPDVTDLAVSPQFATDRTLFAITPGRRIFRSTDRGAAQNIGSPWRLSANVNWFRNNIDALHTMLLFPTRRAFTLAASKDHAWDLTLNNQIRLPRTVELQASYIYYAGRNVPQGRERPRSSVDLAVKWPLATERAELLFTFTDLFNDFAIEHEIVGRGFTALYQNFLETQVATVGLRVRF
jgi:hypothetical protein